jgi:hypothetical protein
MVYKINDTEILLQPTTGKWLPRTELGRDGNGHPIYSTLRDFEIVWVLETPAQQNQLQNFFNTVITTGTASVDLPEYGAATYTFRTYSGCALAEPEQSQYFYENITDVKLLILGIRTA